MLRIDVSSLAITAFQHETGHSYKLILNGYSIQPEPESRYGLSLAHNDAFATIARSTFLTCTFVSASETPRIRSIPSSFAPFGFEAEPGRFQHPEPVTRFDLPCPRFIPGLHSPLGLLSKTLRIKAFNRFRFRKPASPDARFYSFRFPRVESSLRPARLSFRQPWN